MCVFTLNENINTNRNVSYFLAIVSVPLVSNYKMMQVGSWVHPLRFMKRHTQYVGFNEEPLNVCFVLSLGSVPNAGACWWYQTILQNDVNFLLTASVPSVFTVPVPCECISLPLAYEKCSERFPMLTMRGRFRYLAFVQRSAVCGTCVVVCGTLLK